MIALRRSLLLTAAVTLLLMIGCTDHPPTAPAVDQDPTYGQSGDLISARRFFTGRDSFGVALKASLSTMKDLTDPKTATRVEECPGTPDMAFEGMGTATHLGRVNITHSHTVDETNPDLVKWCGTFTMTGTTGGQLSGRYEGTLQDSEFEGTAWVNGGNVRATSVTSEQGRASVSGTLDGDTFHFELDGWLFHHLRES